MIERKMSPILKWAGGKTQLLERIAENMPVDYNNYYEPLNKGDWDKIESVEEKHDFNRRWIGMCRRVLKPNGTIWINGTLHKEMYLTEIENRWHINLSAISAEGTSTKRWDFVVKTASHIFVIETNFYTSGGSKLNETARSYKMIAEEAKRISGFSFVWITDGGGWTSARRNLEETFNVLKDIYNIADMESGVFTQLFN